MFLISYQRNPGVVMLESKDQGSFGHLGADGQLFGLEEKSFELSGPLVATSWLIVLEIWNDTAFV